jgi:hypothetical protein
MSINYNDQPTGSLNGATLRGAKPVQHIVNNVVDQQTAQEQADALEEAVYNFLAEAEAAQKQKQDEAAALFASRAEIALKLQDAKPGDIITLEDGTVVRR